MAAAPAPLPKGSLMPRCGRAGQLRVRLWLQAWGFSFSPGMPFNQLGTLAGSKYYSVEAMYCYLRW